jgi:hypothetical protein
MCLAAFHHYDQLKIVDTSTIMSTGFPLEVAIARVEAYWKQHLPGYMEGDSENAVYPGREGFPTTKHRYAVDVGKHAEVIMCNADARQLARWIVTSCLEAKGSADAIYTTHIRISTYLPVLM